MPVIRYKLLVTLTRKNNQITRTKKLIIQDINYISKLLDSLGVITLHMYGDFGNSWIVMAKHI
jgi:hypothetical protein